VPELPIRRLRAELANAVRRAEAGETSVVTVGGRPVAQLGPLGTGGSTETTLADLVARGVIVAPRRLDTYRPGEPVPVWRATRLDRVLDDVR
jgi:antitoxin (DNA-binding transcriptional repressor) of toxin-antitoxin stability system